MSGYLEFGAAFGIAMVGFSAAVLLFIWGLKKIDGE